MPHRPYVVYTLCKRPCPLLNAMRSLKGVHAKVLKLAPLVEGERRVVEVWVRVHGSRRGIEEYVSRLRGEPGVSVTEVHVGRYSALLRLVIDYSRHCEACGESCCPYSVQPPSTLLDAVLVTPEGILRRHVVLKRGGEKLGDESCTVLAVHELEDCGYSLTPRQEEVLVEAYRSGYYGFPRRVSLKHLAERLGLSVSSLAELLRRAEAKLVESYLYTELPHRLLLSERVSR